MDFIAVVLLGCSLAVLASIIYTGFQQPVLGTGGGSEPSIREKPSADEPVSRRLPPA